MTRKGFLIEDYAHTGTPALLSLVRRIHRSMVNPAEKVNSLKMISIFKIGDGIDFRLANDDQVHVYIYIYNVHNARHRWVNGIQ